MQIVERRERNGRLSSIIIDGITDRDVRSRNFGGAEKKDRNTGRTVNSPGYRNFLLFLDEATAQELLARGCEVKYTRVQNENDIPLPYVSITVSYYLKPVDVHMYANGVDTPLDADHIRILDSADIGNMCLELEFGGEKTHLNGTKYIPVYAQRIHVEVVPNYIAAKYAQYNQPQTVLTAPGTEETDELPF